jgi:RNA polymerase sigma-B factor
MTHATPQPQPDHYADRNEQRAETVRLLRRMRSLPPGDREWSRLREKLIADHMNYARHISRRYVKSEATSEDFAQVAYLALVKAVDGFDPDYGAGFLGYVTAMIIGEIKRHYRDATWAVHVPRRMQELSHELLRATDALTAELGQPPTIDQLARRLATSRSAVIEALDASNAYRTASLNRPVGSETGSISMSELLGDDDPNFERVVDRQVLRGLIAELDERDKRIVLMRFFRGMTQVEIGAELGISQMHVSRLITKLLAQLRAGFGLDAAAKRSPHRPASLSRRGDLTSLPDAGNGRRQQTPSATRIRKG